MHESLDTKITELKEICLQIGNLVETKSQDNIQIGIGYNYILAITNGSVETRAKHYGESIAKAYGYQINYVLGNLTTWRGHEAKAYKDLLKLYLAYFQGKSNTGKLNENVSPLWGMIRGIGD